MQNCIRFEPNTSLCMYTFENKASEVNRKINFVCVHFSFLSMIRFALSCSISSSLENFEFFKIERFELWINGYCSQWKYALLLKNVTHHSEFGRYTYVFAFRFISMSVCHFQWNVIWETCFIIILLPSLWNRTEGFWLNRFRVVGFNQCTFVIRYHYCFGFDIFSGSTFNSKFTYWKCNEPWKTNTSADQIHDLLCVHSNERPFI